MLLDARHRQTLATANGERKGLLNHPGGEITREERMPFAPTRRGQGLPGPRTRPTFMVTLLLKENETFVFPTPIFSFFLLWPPAAGGATAWL